MALATANKTQILNAYFETFSTDIKQKMLDGTNQNEKLALCLAHYKGWLDLSDDLTDIVDCKTIEDSKALFGLIMINLYMPVTNTVLDEIRTVGASMAKGYQDVTFDNFVSDTRRLFKRANHQNGFAFDKFAMLCGPEILFGEDSPSDFNVVCPFSGEITEYPLHTQKVNSERAVKRLGKVEVEDLFSSGDKEVRELLDNICWIEKAYCLEQKVQRLPATEAIGEQLFVAAVAGSVGFIKYIASAISTHAFQLVFPTSCTELRKRLLEQVEKRTIETYEGSVRGPSIDWFTHAERGCRSKLKLEQSVWEFLRCFLARSEDGQIIFHVDENTTFDLACWEEPVLFEDIEPKRYIEEMLKLNKLEVRKPPFSYVKAVKKRLHAKVKGQHGAIESVASSLSNLIVNGGDCHLGTSVFLGMSGTGKTYLAEGIAEAFVEELSLDYQVQILNMEQYNDERDVMKLFGAGSQYSDSALGELTLSVMKNPRTLFVFDEIEKAHPSVIQALLTLLDKGQANDRTAMRAIDFSLCHFVITTNLGSKLIERSSENNLDVRELLTNKKINGGRSLSPEMVNRLQAGTIAVFKPISAATMLSIAKQTCMVTRKMGSVAWPENVEELAVATLGGSVSPRSLATQLSKLEGDITNELVDKVPEGELRLLNKIRFSNESFMDSQDVNVRILSPRKQLEKLSDKNMDIHRQINERELAVALKGNFDVLLVDTEMFSGKIRESIALLKKHTSKVIVTLGNINQQSDVDALISEGSVFTHIALSRNASLDDYRQCLQNIKRIGALAKYTELSIARNMKPTYSFGYQFLEDGIEVNMKSFRCKQMVSTEDADLPFINFAGKPKGSLDDVIGQDSEKSKLRVIVNAMNSADVNGDDCISVPKGYLFTGLPGTGKTHMARCLAAESDMFFFNVNSADLLVGCAVSNVQKLFDVANRYAPSMIFLDEIDSIAKSRQSVGHSSAIVVNALLTAMDGFKQNSGKVFVMAATNNPHELDTALTRAGRFERSIHFNLPTKTSISACVNEWFKIRNCTLPEELRAELTCLLQGATIGRIREIFNNSVLSAKAEGIEWKPTMLIEAVRSAKLGVVTQTAKQSRQQLKYTAYHEVGHLIAHKLLLPDIPVDFVSIQPRGAALGMVVPGSSDAEPLLSRSRVKAYLQVFLAGIAAEHMLGLVGDEQTVGGADDRRKATALAKKAIVQWGMSDSFGFAMLSELETESQHINDEVRNWLAEAFSNISELLGENRELLSAISESLVEREQLDRSEIEKLFEQLYQPQILKAS